MTSPQRWTLSCVAVCLLACAAWAAPPPKQADSPGVKEGRLAGKVKQRLEAPGYVYLLIATSAGDQWAAVPQAAAKPGDQVTVEVQALMGGFESKALKRRFDKVFFGTVGSAPAGGTPALPAGHPTTRAPALKASAALEPAAGPAPRSATGVEGQVQEVLQVPRYTYVRLKLAEGETWAAVPTADLRPGDRARVEKPAPMDGFVSQTLKRTFDRILFGSLGEVTPAKK